jgi:erythromycin esterase-like protein
MTHPTPIHATLDDWIAREAIPSSVDSPATFNAGVAKVVASLGDSLELLGFGEALHGGEDILMLRNRLFQRLVEAHGYSAIAIEGSSFPRARAVNDYVSGHGPASYEAVQDTGFGQGFGRLDANRELVEWMRRYNADPSHRVQLQFYGFDIPTEAYCNASKYRPSSLLATHSGRRVRSSVMISSVSIRSAVAAGESPTDFVGSANAAGFSQSESGPSSGSIRWRCSWPLALSIEAR